MAEEKKESSGLTSAMPVIGAGIDFGADLFGSLFSANQARKNRAFQERMYNRQYQDSIKFWQMQQDWNSPSAQLARLREAGLNPLLMYSNGASGLVAASPAQLPSAPSGAQAHYQGKTGFGQALTQAALINAQLRNIDADTQTKKADAALTESKTKETDFTNILNNLTKDVQIAMKFSQLDLFNAQIRDYQSQYWQRENLTHQQVLSMIQAREYEIKRFHMDLNYQGAMIEQGWENLRIGRVNANASLQQAAAAMMQAKNAARVGNAQVALLSQEYSFLQKANPIKLQTMDFEKLATKAGWKTEQARTFEREFKNKMLQQYGSESTGTMYQNIAPFADQFKTGLGNLLDPRWWTSPLGTYHKKN